MYGYVEFLGTDGPNATGMGASLGHMNMSDKDNQLMHNSFVSSAVPYSVQLGYSDTST